MISTISLTQAERDRLAEWMGWERRRRVESWGKEWAWCKGADRIMSCEFWRPDEKWEHAGMLLDQAAKEGLEPRLYQEFNFDIYDSGRLQCCAIEHDERVFYGREERWPLAICRAILAMLEAQE